MRAAAEDPRSFDDWHPWRTAIIFALGSQEVITKDKATITVDGVAFFQVFDAVKASLRIDARAGALDRQPCRLRPLHHPRNRFRDVFHVGWLQPRFTPPEHRIDGKAVV